jgi:hypothetical protein
MDQETERKTKRRSRETENRRSSSCSTKSSKCHTRWYSSPSAIASTSRLSTG